MKQILIATSNPAKFAEISLFLSHVPVIPVSLTSLGIDADAPENAPTFLENAIMKARYYCQKSGLPTIADDGGFEIDALHGEPGVFSHRWVHRDRESTDEELITYTMERLKDVPLEKRTAQLHLVLAFTIPGGMVQTAEGLIRGIVPLVPSSHRTHGFPYRSLLFLPELNKFYDHALLTDEETQKYNHRRKTVHELLPSIQKALGV